jgi:hypothetical protein
VSSIFSSPTWLSESDFYHYSSTTVSAYLGCLKTCGHSRFSSSNAASSEGTTEYTTCEGLIYASSSTWPESAVFQIAGNGVPLDKLVIGKPATTTDATNGYMSTADLASCVAEAYAAGWSTSQYIPLSRFKEQLTNNE